jgi:hypothetical protein
VKLEVLGVSGAGGGHSGGNAKSDDDEWLVHGGKMRDRVCEGRNWYGNVAEFSKRPGRPCCNRGQRRLRPRRNEGRRSDEGLGH